MYIIVNSPLVTLTLTSTIHVTGSNLHNIYGGREGPFLSISNLDISNLAICNLVPGSSPPPVLQYAKNAEAREDLFTCMTSVTKTRGRGIGGTYMFSRVATACFEC